MDRTERPPVFVEEQRFRQGWLWAVIIAMDAAVCLSLLARLTGLARHQGDGLGDLLALLGAPAICLGITALFFSLRLVTRIDAGEISVRFIPFHPRPVAYSLREIREHSVRTYRPKVEHGDGASNGGRAAWPTASPATRASNCC